MNIEVLPHGPAGLAMRRWIRFTPAQRLGRAAAYLFVIIALAGGGGLLIYLALWLILPKG